MRQLKIDEKLASILHKTKQEITECLDDPEDCAEDLRTQIERTLKEKDEQWGVSDALTSSGSVTQVYINVCFSINSEIQP